jgi:hypothetical protein
MKLDTTTYPNMKRKHQYCDACGALIPAPGFFCVQCDPPEPPEADPEQGLNGVQTILRITLSVLIFIAVVIVKLEIDLQKIFFSQEVDRETPINVVKDKDFKLLFKVKVKLANVRDRPIKKSKIIFKLNKGESVEILNKKGEWSEIRSNSGIDQKTHIGWIKNRLLESEIK